MKFEMPKMNISMFEMENVATEASAVLKNNLADANTKAAELVNSAESTVAKITITF